MKIFILTIIAIFGITAVSAAQRIETLTLRVGQQKTADRGKIKIKLISVIEDSRCPINARCIWAGNAKIKISISKGRSAAKTYELNTGLDPHSINVDGYEIKFVDLTPYPGEPTKSDRMTTVAIPTIAKLSVTRLHR
ncbi:MAG: hypothetical protein ABIO36_01670 [Pyrinomonadaceae bacterium]